MRVVIAPEGFDGTLSAGEAAQALARGWRRHAPDDDLDLCPLSDGGPGFVDAVHAAAGGRLVPVGVPGPLGGSALAVILVTTLMGDDVPTVFVEAAQAGGLALVPPDRRDPGRASSLGLGALLAAAVEAGAEAGAGRVVVGVGGLATNDGGAGLLAGLARGLDVPGLPAELAAGGLALRGLTADRLGALPALLARLRERLGGAELVAATDVDTVLLGFKGTSSLDAAGRGAGPEQAQLLDLALSDLARAAVDATGSAQRLVAEPGAGAGGGVGFALGLLGARREPGAATAVAATGLARRLAGAGLVVTGEGDLDWRSLRGSVLTAVARLAQEAAVPAVAVPGQVQVGRRELLSVGIESVYPVARDAAGLAASLAAPAERLADRAERVARTWSPRPSRS